MAADAFREAFVLAFESQGEDAIRRAAELLRGVGVAAGASDEKLVGMLQEIQKLGEQSRQITGLIALKSGLAEIRQESDTARAKIAAISSGFVQFKGGLEQAEKEVDKLRGRLVELATAENKQAAELARMEGSLRRAGVDTANLGTAQQRLNDKAAAATKNAREYATGLAAASAGAREAARSTKELGDQSGRSATLLDQVRANLGKIAVTAAAVKAALAGINFVGDAAGRAQAIEASLSRMRAIAEGTAAQFDTLGEALDTAAREVNVGTDVAAAALAALAQQGQSADDAMASLVPTLQLAKIAQIDVAQAAGLVDDALDQFGLGADQAGRVVDVLTVAAKGGKDALAGMSGTMAGLAPLARELGMGFEETAGLLGLLAQNGFGAEKASRALRTVLSDLQDPTSRLRQNLFALGDSSGSFSKAIETLATSGERGKDAILDLDGSSRALVQFLVQQGPGALAAFTQQLNDAAGAAGRTAQVLDDNLRGALSRFGNAFDRIGEQLVEPALDPLKKEVESLAAALEAFAASDAFDGIKASIGALVTEGVQQFDTFIRSIDWKGLVDSARTSLQDVATAMRGFSSDIDGFVTGATTAINTVGAVFNSLGTIIRGVASAGAAAIGGLIDALALLAKVKAFTSIGFEAEAAAIQAERLHNVALSFYASARQNFERAGAAGERLVSNLEKLDAAADDVAPSAARAAEGISDITGAAERAEVQTGQLTEALGLVPDYLRDVAASGELANPVLLAVSESSDQAAAALGGVSAAARQLGGGPLQSARDALRAASDEYARLLLAGEQTPETMAAAAAEFNRSSQALARLEAGAGSGKEKLDALKSAATTLKITLQADLVDAAARAEGALNTVSGSLGQNGVELADVRRAFDAWAAAARAAAADADAAVKAQTESTIAAKAAALGLTQQLQDTGTQAKAAGDTTQAAAKAAADGFDKTADSAKAAGDAAKNAGEQQEEAATSVSGAAAALSSAIQENRQAFLDLSDGAAATFDRILFDLSRTQVAFGTQRAAGQLLQTIADAAEITRNKIADQRRALDDMIDTLGAYGTAGAQAFGAVGQGAANTIALLNGQIAAVREGRSQFDLLGQQDLSRLQAALEQARQRVEALQQQAQQAKEQLADLGSELQDQIDQINGNQADIENRRYQEQLAQIAELAQLGGEAAAAEAEARRKQAEELHRLKLEQINREAQASLRAADEQRDRDQQLRSQSTTNGGSGQGAVTSGGGGAGALGELRIDVVHKISGDGVNNISQQQLERMLEGLSNNGKLQRIFNDGLRRAAKLAGFGGGR